MYEGIESAVVSVLSECNWIKPMKLTSWPLSQVHHLFHINRSEIKDNNDNFISKLKYNI